MFLPPSLMSLVQCFYYCLLCPQSVITTLTTLPLLDMSLSLCLFDLIHGCASICLVVRLSIHPSIRSFYSSGVSLCSLDPLLSVSSSILSSLLGFYGTIPILPQPFTSHRGSSWALPRFILTFSFLSSFYSPLSLFSLCPSITLSLARLSLSSPRLYVCVCHHPGPCLLSGRLDSPLPGRLDSPFLKQQHSPSEPSPPPLRTPPHARLQPTAPGRYWTGGGAGRTWRPPHPPSQDHSRGHSPPILHHEPHPKAAVANTASLLPHPFSPPLAQHYC